MKTLVIGGPFNGEWREVLDGSGAWVDLIHGTTHRIGYLTWAVNAPGNDGVPIVLERWRLPIAVHGEIAGHPAEMQIAQQAMTNMAITELMRHHGIEVEVPNRVPDTPGGLVGTDWSAP